MAGVPMILPRPQEPSPTVPPLARPLPIFRAVYDEFFPFVWRMLWRLGVGPGSVADAAQDVFMVVDRRLSDLRGPELAQSFIYGIVVRVAGDYRRVQRRKGLVGAADSGQLPDSGAKDAYQQVEHKQALALLDRLLDELDEERREVLVLVELEEMSVPRVAALLGANANTIYTRLRRARQDFEQALARHKARERRQP
jgi:RNA polymerase sigma-70 factor, ECF subfamily